MPRIVATARQPRGPVAWTFLVLLVLWNALMALVLVAALWRPAPQSADGVSGLGALVGGFASLAILAIWTCGSVILGTLTHVTRRTGLVFYAVDAER
jgi:hypothetical protein